VCRPVKSHARQAVQVTGQQPQGVGMETVVGPVAVAFGADQPGRPQGLEVVADQRLAHAELLGQVGDAQLLGGQQLDDPPAQGITERPGHLQRRGGAGSRCRDRGHLDQD
jgi:hypothetical protein